ncbi:ArnT family glycosyltransferase [Iningainema tapete]|uniref:Glycosyltransferase family 39 protein n=1 Tax=Iningainema tapete BLCC-T55 TaxID=2748662 RepID=A0A8J6XJQ3_9CYAN|nr:glycosyltransferase family 39 protein [Iningainema tapete]MBD2777279.1 glycosyltransferase family 39 protein [Iningainema tapete BLCC-T55]
MQFVSFIWGRLEKQYRTVDQRVDQLWMIVLLLAAVLMFTINLGGLPLRDWDEGTVAQVAREIWQAPLGSLHWLYPTLGGEPYHNKPPLMHLLIAWAYSLGGMNEWTTRISGALLTAFSVPLLYCIGREIFRQRWASVYSALIYLTMLPVVRHGRLAMLDGAAVFFLLVMLLCVLRSRRDLRYCLGIGIAFGLICLTKGILGILFGAIAIIFLFWDTPRLLTSRYMWIAILIGCIPVALWFSAQWIEYGDNFTSTGLVDQSISRVWKPVEGNAGKPWYYILEILKYTWPWLLFLPHSLRLAWENRNLSWAKLVLVWSAVYLVSISLMGTKLPWYVFPIYPSLALAIGALCGEIENLPVLTPYPRPWVVLLFTLSIVAGGGSIYFGWGTQPQPDLQIVFATVAATMALAAILAQRADKQFLIILLWGTYLALMLFMISDHWVWELAETYPVKPVATILKRGTPSSTKVYTSYPHNRPSLNFYSQRTIIPATHVQLEHFWQNHKQPYFLLNDTALTEIKLESIKVIDKAESWTLVTKGVGEKGSEGEN